MTHLRSRVSLSFRSDGGASPFTFPLLPPPTTPASILAAPITSPAGLPNDLVTEAPSPARAPGRNAPSRSDSDSRMPAACGCGCGWCVWWMRGGGGGGCYSRGVVWRTAGVLSACGCSFVCRLQGRRRLLAALCRFIHRCRCCRYRVTLHRQRQRRHRERGAGGGDGGGAHGRLPLLVTSHEGGAKMVRATRFTRAARLLPCARSYKHFAPCATSAARVPLRIIGHPVCGGQRRL